MSGMGTGLSSHSSLVVSAFHRALWLQFLLVLFVVAALAILRSILRARQFGVTAESGSAVVAASNTVHEPVAHRLVRVGFGLLWILDGVLQGQAAMPLSMPSQVLTPAASSSPSWVQHVVHFGSSLWSEHPVTAAAAAVWIQIGIGLLLLVVPFGPWSRLAGTASAVWGLLVWAFGEAFGGIFGSGVTWLFGAPGAVLFYAVAGMLMALPTRMWSTPALGRWVLRCMGFFFVGMAILQAWPGRGFWQGQTNPHVTAGTLTAMVRSMAGIQQPTAFAAIVRAFARLDAAHGWAVNLFVVVALGLVGLGILLARPRVTRVAVLAGCVLCVAAWFFVEDLGFFGGVGTDPNSMIPMALVLVAGYLAMTRAPIGHRDQPAPSWGLRSWRHLDPSFGFRIGASLGACAIVLLGAVPMAAAATASSADPILTESVNGTPVQEHVPAPRFSLLDQYGHTVSLSTLRGRVIALTFLDPVCTTDCPVIAQEFRVADDMLGSLRDRVAMIAIVANPIYRSIRFVAAFDRQEYLTQLPNWYFLTGATEEALSRTLAAFGASAIVEPAGAMVDHSEFAEVIDGQGYVRTILSTDPGAATGALQSSFSTLLVSELRQAMRPASAQ